MESERVAAAASPSSRWPARLRELALLRRRPLDPPARDAVAAELWKLINVALHRYVRDQGRRFGRLDAADVVDVAADKSLDLVGRLDHGRWDPARDTDSQVRSYLAAVARNGVVDLLRRRRREALAAAAAAWGVEEARGTAPSSGDVASGLDGARYAGAIVACAARLTARARLAWFLKVFCELPAAQIARHPEVRTSVAGVHLMLNRSRRQLGRCMRAQGLEPGRMPPGTFTALWEMVDAERRARTAGPGVEAAG